MDSFVVMVDAGYLYVAGGKLCLGSSNRSEVHLDFKAAAKGLVEMGRNHSGFRHLRTYWYDAATNAQPTPAHYALGFLPGVKLRLGRLTSTGQKGVDSRIVRDLIVLSRDRAVSAAYVLSGDEDIREGVAEAQDQGVSVFLVGVTPAPDEIGNQALALISEADDHLILDKDAIQSWFSVREFDRTFDADPQTPEEEEALSFGEQFGANWAATATSLQMQTLLAGQPQLPNEVDRRLLEEARGLLGDLYDRQNLRKSLRGGFWRAIERRPKVMDG